MSVFSPGESALLPRLVTRYINLSACIWVQGTLRFLVWSFMRTFPSASRSLYFILIENILFFIYNSVTILQLCSASAWCTMHKTGLPYCFWNHTHLFQNSYGSHAIVTFCNFDWVYWLESGLSWWDFKN